MRLGFDLLTMGYKLSLFGVYCLEIYVSNYFAVFVERVILDLFIPLVLRLEYYLIFV